MRMSLPAISVGAGALTALSSLASSQVVPPPPPAASSETSGRVRMVLNGPQGEVNGLLLESGTILRFPPDPTGQLATALEPRQSVVAEGDTVANSLGTVVDVQELGPSRDRLVAVAPPMPPPAARGPAEPRRRTMTTPE